MVVKNKNFCIHAIHVELFSFLKAGMKYLALQSNKRAIIIIRLAWRDASWGHIHFHSWGKASSWKWMTHSLKNTKDYLLSYWDIPEFCLILLELKMFMKHCLNVQENQTSTFVYTKNPNFPDKIQEWAKNMLVSF